MLRYIVFSVLIADLILNVDGCSSIASFLDFVTDPITQEIEVGGNVYELLNMIISLNFCNEKHENIKIGILERRIYWSNEIRKVNREINL